MAEKLSMTYPCGFSFVAPYGEDDAVAVAQLHIERIQEGLLGGISRAESRT